MESVKIITAMICKDKEDKHGDGDNEFITRHYGEVFSISFDRANVVFLTNRSSVQIMVVVLDDEELVIKRSVLFGYGGGLFEADPDSEEWVESWTIKKKVKKEGSI